MVNKKEKTTEMPTPIMDIAKPGSAAVTHATSRPIIVSNRPLMQDPMVKDPVAEPALMPKPPAAKVVINPITETDNHPTTPTESQEPAPTVPVAKTEAAPTPEQKPADSSSSQENNEGGTADMLPDLSDKESAKKAALEAEAVAKIQTELDQLVDAKTYFLPINSVEKRRSKHVVIFGLLLITFLILAWVNLALDAGFIKISGISPITDIF